MFEGVRVRQRKSTKYGITYEYRFEIAPIGRLRRHGGSCDHNLRTLSVRYQKVSFFCGFLQVWTGQGHGGWAEVEVLYRILQETPQFVYKLMKC